MDMTKLAMVPLHAEPPRVPTAAERQRMLEGLSPPYGSGSPADNIHVLLAALEAVERERDNVHTTLHAALASMATQRDALAEALRQTQHCTNQADVYDICKAALGQACVETAHVVAAERAGEHLEPGLMELRLKTAHCRPGGQRGWDVTPCPNCDADLLDADDPCPDCNHNGGDPDCDCEFCDRERQAPHD